MNKDEDHFAALSDPDDDENHSESYIFISIVKIGLPAMLCQFIAMLQELVNIWVIGHLNDPELLVAVGLGNVVINILGYGMFLGLNGALNTFVAQAYGANEIELCGVYLWRAKIVMTLLFICLIPLYLRTEALFDVL